MKTYTPSFILLTMALAVGLTATGCGRKTPKPEAAKGKAPEELALIIRAMPADWRNFERRLSVQGTLESKVFAHVAARTDGNLDTLWVDRGDAVVAGETPLFQIDPISRQNALTIAQQNLAVAQASLSGKGILRQNQGRGPQGAAISSAMNACIRKAISAPANLKRRCRAPRPRRVSRSPRRKWMAERQVKQAEANLAIAERIWPTPGRGPHQRPGQRGLAGASKCSLARWLRIDDTSQVEAAAFCPPSTTAKWSRGRPNSACKSAIRMPECIRSPTAAHHQPHPAHV